MPYASSLCGACYEVCPVKINIPEVLIDLRAKVVDQERKGTTRWSDAMYLGMKAAHFAFADATRLRLAQRFAKFGMRLFTNKDGWIRKLPGLGARWTLSRDLQGMPDQTFRQWWAARETSRGKEAK